MAELSLAFSRLEQHRCSNTFWHSLHIATMRNVGSPLCCSSFLQIQERHASLKGCPGWGRLIVNLAGFRTSPAKTILVWLLPRGSGSQRQRSCSRPSSSLTSNQLSFSLELQCPARSCQSPARAWYTEPPVSNAVRRSTRSHVYLERVVS